MMRNFSRTFLLAAERVEKKRKEKEKREKEKKKKRKGIFCRPDGLTVVVD